MNITPASDFISRYVNAYGESWSETFGHYTSSPTRAKAMAELIDDLEANGQRSKVYVSQSGMVIEGHKIVLASYVIGNDIEFVELAADSDVEIEGEPYSVQFDIVSGGYEFFNDIDALFSFRCGDDWVIPLDAELDESSEDADVLILCPGGEKTADMVAATIADRLQRLAGVEITAVRVSAHVDEDAHEW